MPAVNLCSRLVSVPPICKSAGGRGIYCAPLLKILNVSERPRTGVVPNNSKFFARKTCRWKAYMEVRFSTGLRVLFTLRLVSGTTIFKSAGCKGIPFVAAHKLILNVSKIRLHPCRCWKADKLMNSLTEKADRLSVFGQPLAFSFLNDAVHGGRGTTSIKPRIKNDI